MQKQTEAEKTWRILENKTQKNIKLMWLIGNVLAEFNYRKR